MLRLTGWPMANALIAAHIAFHRNVPMLVHILFWYFGVPALLPQAVAGGSTVTAANSSCPAWRSAW